MPFDVFISYSRNDRELRNKLGTALSTLRNQNLIKDWYDGDIPPGSEWKKQIFAHLDQDQIVLLLISPDFMASKFCYSIEMQQAIARHDNNLARVIPIILRPTDWEGTPFEKLAALPSDGRPITSWLNQDEAFLDVSKGIRKAIHDLNAHFTVSSPEAADTTLVGTETEQVPIWNIPFQKNPYFTGREDDLIHLHNALTEEKNVALTQPQVISGLGGVGKTQLAIEYAYRHRDDYHYIFWVRADTNDLLVSDYTEIASLVSLPLKGERDQNLILGAVKNWLQTHSNWFLILDNADNLDAVRGFLPKKGKGHVLLTTRAPVVGIEAQGIELDTMKPQESDLFLLRRARLLDLDASIDTVSGSDRSKAHEIAEIMGDLPLALAQAGAYIERTRCGLAGYLERYKQRRVELLKERSGLAFDHPEPVATTWSLSFERVKQTNPVAADLLCLCAFLHPDAIPEEILIDGASALTPALQSVAKDLLALDDAIVELLRYSLIRRNLDAKTLTIHRLVQAVLKDAMDEDLLHQWTERTVRAVNHLFPDTPSSRVSEQHQLYLPHAQVCAALITQWGMVFTEAAHLLNKAGYVLYLRGQYTEAEQLLTQAVIIGEKSLGAEHREVGQSLTHLAELYRVQGKYNQAIPLCEQALAIHEKTLGPDHPDVAQDLNILARLYQHKGKFIEAEPFYQQALAIHEKTLGPDHPDVAQDLNDLATLYTVQGKYAQAEPLFKQAQAIREKALGLDHPNVAQTLSDMAANYSKQGKYAQSESLYQQAQAIREKALGPDHPDVAYTLSGLAANYSKQGKYAQAGPLYRRLYSVYLRTLGPGDIKTMEALKHCTNAAQRVRQRINANQKTRQKGKRHK